MKMERKNFIVKINARRNCFDCPLYFFGHSFISLCQILECSNLNTNNIETQLKYLITKYVIANM